MKKFFEEFKAFALKGNVMDMAIGVIIGAAFGAIVTALTDSFEVSLLSVCVHRIIRILDKHYFSTLYRILFFRLISIHRVRILFLGNMTHSKICSPQS